MPWKPPCYQMNCNVGPALAKQCDAVIFSPESYNTYCVETCTAKPTVSYSKIVIGKNTFLTFFLKKLHVFWYGHFQLFSCSATLDINFWSFGYIRKLAFGALWQNFFTLGFVWSQHTAPRNIKLTQTPCSQGTNSHLVEWSLGDFISCAQRNSCKLV